jgi:hypothetical protein
MKRVFVLILFLTTVLSHAQETYLGLYLQGNKLGYSSYKSSDDTLNGKPVKRNDSLTVINAGLLGTSMNMEIQSVSWSDANGRPLKMRFVSRSSGRTQTVDAMFNGMKITVVVLNNGAETKKTLEVPAGGEIVDDPLSPIVAGGSAVGTRKSFYVLDPTTVTLIKNDIVMKGPAKVMVKGQEVSATRVDIIDPRANTTAYLSSKGDLIKAEGPMGIEMIPESKEEATGPEKGGYRPSVDLAVITSIKTDKPITDPAQLGALKLRITGKNLSGIPSDTYQTATGKNESWVVNIHPAKLSDSPGSTIAQAGKSKPQWLKPSMNVPSQSAQFKSLAKQILGSETNAKKAALKIKSYVQRSMHPNAGIGVLRDASEVLKTKEGVCRDYAILTATLMRAAGIPAKLASGLVNWDGNFYYHAWVEVWDGTRWLGMDSTTPDPQISAAHVKLGDGNVEEAFTFIFLDKVKIEVLEAKHW